MPNTNQAQREDVVALLQRAYTMELESVANYLAASVNLEGILAEEVKRALGEDVQEELGHAQQLARRLKELQASTPVIAELDLHHSKMDNTATTLDLEAVIRAVIDDEQAAIDNYRHIIEQTDGADYVTQDLCVKLLADEESHRTKFELFIKEFEHAV